MVPTTTPTRFLLLPAAAALLLLTVVGALVTWFGLPAIGWPGQRGPATLAVVVCGGFGVLALLPVWALDRAMPLGAAYGFMIGILVRMAGCGAAVFIGQANGLPRSFGYWTAGFYLLFLAVEMILIGRYIRHLKPAPSGETRLEAHGC